MTYSNGLTGTLKPTVKNSYWPKENDFVWKDAVAEPSSWDKPGIVMFFNLECPGCVSRGVPFLKKLARGFEDELVILMIHTLFGHKVYARDEVVPTLTHFAENFATIPFPIALDLKGDIAESWEVLGTPHWLLFAEGELVRSIFGSQDNAQIRLEYTLAELLETSDVP